MASIELQVPADLVELFREELLFRQDVEREWDAAAAGYSASTI